MVNFLIKHLIPHSDQTGDPAVREAYGTLAGCVGICLNVLLFIGKFVAGSIVGSIAVTADAFNNLSDAGSSLITLFGFRLAGKRPHSDHPFGHGRIEYVAGLIVSLLIILMGVTLARESLDKMLHPQDVTFSLLSAGILAASILVKLYMFSYNRALSKKLNSSTLKATATDSLSDAFATLAVLISMIISHLTGLRIDGYAGILVALMILWGGFGAARDTISPLLGTAPDPEFVKKNPVHRPLLPRGYRHARSGNSRLRRRPADDLSARGGARKRRHPGHPRRHRPRRTPAPRRTELSRRHPYGPR